jgi:hypothetical protein
LRSVLPNQSHHILPDTNPGEHRRTPATAALRSRLCTAEVRGSNPLSSTLRSCLFAGKIWLGREPVRTFCHLYTSSTPTRYWKGSCFVTQCYISIARSSLINSVSFELRYFSIRSHGCYTRLLVPSFSFVGVEEERRNRGCQSARTTEVGKKQPVPKLEVRPWPKQAASRSNTASSFALRFPPFRYSWPGRGPRDPPRCRKVRPS